VPVSTDLSISCCRVIFFAGSFFFDFDSVVVPVFAAGAVVVAVAAGAVVVVVAAGAVVVAAAPVSVAWASAWLAGKDANAIVAAIKQSLCMKTSNCPFYNAVSVILWRCTTQAAIK
jgi:hypothetical protein